MPNALSRKGLLCLIGLFFNVLLFAQDMIVTKSGENISCKIISVDSLRIIYRLRTESSRHEIARSEVENYYLSKATATELEWLSKPLVEFLSIGFHGALAYPVGEFASMDPNSEESGLALKGACFYGDITFKLSPYAGISLSYVTQRHAMNYQTVTNWYNNEYSKIYGSPISIF